MQAKVLYLIVIVTLLLAACSPASLGLAPMAVAPASPNSAVSAPAAPAADSGQGQAAPAAQDLGQGGGQGGGTPPAAAIAACTAKAAQDTCSFTSQKGTETGVCELVQTQLACSPKHDPSGGAQSSSGGGSASAATPAVQGQGRGQVQGQDQSQAQGYNIEQAISDKAQGMTISYDALAFLTGDLGADSFFPPGKVADFWGFQYLRDNDPSQMGHAGDFLTSAAMNMLNDLTAAQRADLVALAKSQVASINEYGYKRFVLIKAFNRQLTGDLPAGTTGLSLDAVKAYSAELYKLDGQISFARAALMGKLLSSMSANQKAYLDAMKGKGMKTWPVVTEPADISGLDRDVKVAVMTYAGDMLAWYVGSVEADVYFCPERHGTYFGSFYLKDIKAMSDPTYSIPTNMTGDLGEAMLQQLSPDQAKLVTDLVTIEKTPLTGIVDTRTAISKELRKFLAGGTADESTVLGMMQQYGAYDGEIIYHLAVNFSKVGQTLTDAQKAKLMDLRHQTLGDFTPKGAFLYAVPIAIPQVQNTDFLFK